MKIGIIGATGKLGKIITSKLLFKQLDVTAIVRDKHKIEAHLPILQKDLFALTAEDIRQFDVLISAYGPSIGHEKELINYINHLTQLFSNITKTRLIICGGVGPTYFDKQRTLLVSDSPQLPNEVIALAKNETESFNQLKNQTHFKWTYMVPALNLDLNGSENHHYAFFDDILHFNTKGENYLSYWDYASAIIEESLSKNARLHQIVSVADLSNR